MNSRKKIVCVALVLMAGFLTALPSVAQEYEYKKPELQIDIPNVVFSKVTSKTSGDVTTITVPFLAEYIGGLYNYLILTAGVIAAVMSVMGGFQYLTAGGDAGKVKAAKERITNAIAGVILTLGAYTILNTVSPTFIKLKGLQINTVKLIPFSAVEAEDWSDNPNPQVPPDLVRGVEGEHVNEQMTSYCGDVEKCKKLCATPADWPDGPPFTLAEKSVQDIPTGPGLIGNGQKASAEMISKLQAAGEKAAAAGMEIIVESGYRSLKSQMEVVCQTYIGNAEKEKKIGLTIPWPGASTHGRGTAVAVSLRDTKSGELIVTAGDCNDQAAGKSGTYESSKTLNSFMFAAGFSRYQNVMWEYKLGKPQCICVSDGVGNPQRCPFQYPLRCNRACGVTGTLNR